MSEDEAKLPEWIAEGSFYAEWYRLGYALRRVVLEFRKATGIAKLLDWLATRLG